MPAMPQTAAKMIKAPAGRLNMRGERTASPSSSRRMHMEATPFPLSSRPERKDVEGPAVLYPSNES